MAKRKKKEQLEPNQVIAEPSSGKEMIHAEARAGENPPKTVDAVSRSEASELASEQATWADRTATNEPAPAHESARKSSYPDPNKPFSIAHNNQAGVRLLKFDRFKQTQLAFREAVTESLHQRLTEAGYRYRPEEDVYTKQYGTQGEPLAILEAKRLYDALVDQLLQDAGAKRGNER